MDFIQYYIDQYQRVRTLNLPEFAFDVKDTAMKRLSGATFPSDRDEKYRYTNVASAFERELAVYSPSAGEVSSDAIRRIIHSDLLMTDAYRILIHNGRYRYHDAICRLPKGIIAGSFASMIGQFKHSYRSFFGNGEFADDVLVNLNTMLCGDGFFLYVPAGAKPSKPIQIINLFDGNSDTLIQPRNLVMMGAGSSADLLVNDRTFSGESYVCNDVTEVVLNREATLDMVRQQKVNGNTCLITNMTVRQAESSRMNTHYIALGGGIVRNHVNVRLAGQQAAHIAGGLSITKHNEHADHDVLMVHESPDCRSDQKFKHILSDTSTGAFTGRIIVAKDAQKTVAYQRSSNILLDMKAKMNIRPQLEIYADDVKCSHGATVGQLDAEVLFYLRSRGIDEAEAKKTLLNAFAGELLDRISNEAIRENIAKMI